MNNQPDLESFLIQLKAKLYAISELFLTHDPTLYDKPKVLFEGIGLILNDLYQETKAVYEKEFKRR